MKKMTLKDFDKKFIELQYFAYSEKEKMIKHFCKSKKIKKQLKKTKLKKLILMSIAYCNYHKLRDYIIKIAKQTYK